MRPDRALIGCPCQTSVFESVAGRLTPGLGASRSTLGYAQRPVGKAAGSWARASVQGSGPSGGPSVFNASCPPLGSSWVAAAGTPLFPEPAAGFGRQPPGLLRLLARPPGRFICQARTSGLPLAPAGLRPVSNPTRSWYWQGHVSTPPTAPCRRPWTRLLTWGHLQLGALPHHRLQLHPTRHLGSCPPHSQQSSGSLCSQAPPMVPVVGGAKPYGSHQPCAALSPGRGLQEGAPAPFTQLLRPET